MYQNELNVLNSRGWRTLKLFSSKGSWTRHIQPFKKSPACFNFSLQFWLHDVLLWIKSTHTNSSRVWHGFVEQWVAIICKYGRGIEKKSGRFSSNKTLSRHSVGGLRLSRGSFQAFVTINLFFVVLIEKKKIALPRNF